MEKGYYKKPSKFAVLKTIMSQSTIKMDKGYYAFTETWKPLWFIKVAIHNKNGQGLLQSVL